MYTYCCINPQKKYVRVQIKRHEFTNIEEQLRLTHSISFNVLVKLLNIYPSEKSFYTYHLLYSRRSRSYAAETEHEFLFGITQIKFCSRNCSMKAEERLMNILHLLLKIKLCKEQHYAAKAHLPTIKNCSGGASPFLRKKKRGGTLPLLLDDGVKSSQFALKTSRYHSRYDISQGQLFLASTEIRL